MLNEVKKILEKCQNPKETHMPSTILYNEGWLLRLVMNWFANNRDVTHDLAFYNDANWFSEALLPSIFLPRQRGDKRGENHTHADGVIGHIIIGDQSKAGLTLQKDAKQFIVLEAKIYSSLSSGISNARYYNQAARNVACMAEVLKRNDVNPKQVTKLGFYILAPLEQFKKVPDFKSFTEIHDLSSRHSVPAVVNQRVGEYKYDKKHYEEVNHWHRDWFNPMLEHLDIKLISWEEIIEFITNHDTQYGTDLNQFYQDCLLFNKNKSS